MTSTRRILLIGAQGQLGRALQALAPAHWRVMACTRSQLDITRVQQVRTCVQAFRPHVIINAAAYNAVDAAEMDEAQTDAAGSSTAWRVNAQGPGILAHAARSVGARLLHVSTDYVFDGRGNQPYDEHHPPNPLNRYGASKLAGEQAVLLEQPDALIVRTSWLFSEFVNTRRPNFIHNVITQLEQGQPLRVTTVQHSAPTCASHLATAIIRLLDIPNVAGGLYHYRDTPDLTRCDYARTIRQLWIETRALDANTIPPVQAITEVDLASAFVNPAPRPAYSVLNCQRLTRLGIPPAPWLPALRRVIAAV